ncbi:META domain-containing protein [Plebeiibacterium marinum]|nr:META domain-containing protein [Plebeiobacterium marinum]
MYRIVMRIYMVLLVVALLLGSCRSMLTDSRKQDVRRQSMVASNLFEMQMKGVDFCASGCDPEWRLEVDFENNLTFYSELLANQVVVNAESVLQSANRDSVVYKIKDGRRSIYIAAETIQNPFMAEKPIKVHVVCTKGKDIKEYEGSGVYYCPIAMHDKWQLHKINGKLVQEDGRQSVPYMEIHLENNRVNGFLGCNKFGGRVFFGKEVVCFDRLVSTKMACLHANIEKEFSKALSGNEFKYSFVDEMLVLEGINDKLIFKKEE